MPKEILTSIIVGLASWRLANLLVNESGPFDIFERIRYLAGIRVGEVNGFLPLLFSCVYCMSVWTTIAAYLTYIICPTIVIIIAAMTIALIANRFAGDN